MRKDLTVLTCGRMQPVDDRRSWGRREWQRYLRHVWSTSTSETPAPADQLRQDLETFNRVPGAPRQPFRGICGAAARAAGIPSVAISSWLRPVTPRPKPGSRNVARSVRRRIRMMSTSNVPTVATPDAARLRQLAAAIGAEPLPYAMFLDERDRFAAYELLPKSAQKLAVVCPVCDELRDVARVHIDFVQRERAKQGHRPFPIREVHQPGGSVVLAIELLCSECRTKTELPKYRDKARQGVKKWQMRNKEKVRESLAKGRGLRTAAQVEKMAKTRIRRGTHHGHTLQYCPQCTLLHHLSPAHAICAHRYSSLRLNRPELELPPIPLSRPGRAPSGALASRDLRLLGALADALPDRSLIMPLLAKKPLIGNDSLTLRNALRVVRGRMSSEFQPDRRRRRRQLPSEAAVVAALRRFARGLPGSWALLYARRPTGAPHEDSLVRRQRKLAELQAMLPLPAALQPLIKAGARDATIRRLSALRWTAEQIIAHIGDLDGQRTRAVVASMEQADIKRELAIARNGHRRTGVDIARTRLDASRPTRPSGRSQRGLTFKLSSSQAVALLDAPNRTILRQLAQQFSVTYGHALAIHRGKTSWGAPAGPRIDPPYHTNRDLNMNSSCSS
jgi:hypothetical protein